MQHVFKDLLKHSSVYALAPLLSRLASVLLLPLYTRHLTKADYGCNALLELTSGLLGLLIGAGFAPAVARYQSHAKNDAERNRVWWSGLTVVAGLATTILLFSLVFRAPLAALMLGTDVPNGQGYFLLTLPTLWFTTVAELPILYLRVRRWSGTLVTLIVSRLLFHIGLAILFVAILDFGLTGVLLASLISQGTLSVILLTIFLRGRGRYEFDGLLVRQLAAFSGPLVLRAFLILVMQQSDRYILRVFWDKDAVGLYSLAASIGMGINSLILFPFNAIWGVAIYDIEKLPNARQIYVQVFVYFTCGLMLLMLGVSLFAKPLLTILATSSYLAAVHLIPIVCLAYVFFSLQRHFEVPALLAKQTVSLLPACVAASIVNVGFNLLLVPFFGEAGAAWVSVLTFVTFAFVGLWRYRLIDCYDYPFARCGAILAGMIATFVACQEFDRLDPAPALALTLRGLAWLGWLIALGTPAIRPVLELWGARSGSPQAQAVPVLASEGK